MNTALDVVTIILLVMVGIGLTGIYIYQKRSRIIFRDLHANLNKHVWATAALHKSIVDVPSPLPGSNGWALSSELLAHLVSKVLERKPKLVVELGSGMSTVVLGLALKRTGGRLVSIEADEKYFRETESMLNSAMLDDSVTLIHAPLKKYDAHHTWYTKSALSHLTSIDMLLVDGPPRTTCSLARYPALPFFYPRLSPNATIILDDADRIDEKKILSRWKDEFSVTDVETLPFPHSPTLLKMPGHAVSPSSSSTH